MNSSRSIVFSLIALLNQNKVNPRRAKKKVPFTMTIESVKLMHEVSPEHLRMGTVRI